ncbi:MAG: acyltransferase domain-containing protein [Burkholderiaceae bacterium]
MSLALIFSGQGLQHPDMLPWLEDDDLIAAMCRRLGIADWRVALADPVWARTNVHAQVLITGTSLAAWRQIAALVPEPVGVAGYSVGELASFSAAGVFDAERAVHLALQRAELMDMAGLRAPGGLMGVTGLPRARLQSMLEGSAVTIAISNGEDSAVLGGPRAALDAVEAVATQQGARVTRLAVEVASHTPAMRDAARGFGELLGSVAFEGPRWPLFSDAADRVWTSDQARIALSLQIATTVRWDDCMDHLAARAPRCVLEIGGGQALSRLWQQRHPGIPVRAGDEFRSRDGLAAWVSRCCAN